MGSRGSCAGFGSTNIFNPSVRWTEMKHHVDHIREGPSVFSGTQESDSNGVVDDGPFPPFSNSRPNVELDTTVPPTVEVSEPIEGQGSDSESSR